VISEKEEKEEYRDSSINRSRSQINITPLQKVNSTKVLTPLLNRAPSLTNHNNSSEKSLHGKNDSLKKNGNQKSAINIQRIANIYTNVGPQAVSLSPRNKDNDKDGRIDIYQSYLAKRDVNNNPYSIRLPVLSKNSGVSTKGVYQPNYIPSSQASSNPMRYYYKPKNTDKYLSGISKPSLISNAYHESTINKVKGSKIELEKLNNLLNKYNGESHIPGSSHSKYSNSSGYLKGTAIATKPLY